MAVGGSVLECSTPSFGYRLAVDLGNADLRRQTAEVSRAPTVPQRVPDASVYRRLSPTRGSAASSSTISATAPFDGRPARRRRALSLRHVPRAPTFVYVWFIAARAAMNGPSATVGMVHAGGPAHGDRPRLERERDAAHLTGPRARGSTRASNSGTDSCPGAPHTHGTVNAACGWRNMRSQWSLRPALRIGSEDPACGPARAASDRAWPLLTIASCRPDLRGRRLVRVGRLQTGGTSPVGSAPVRRW